MYSASFGTVGQTTSRGALRRAVENVSLVADLASALKDTERSLSATIRFEVQMKAFSASSGSLEARGLDSPSPV
jgi:hypothetical protein